MNALDGLYEAGMCVACGMPKPEYAKCLCHECTAQEWLVSAIEQWVAIGEKPALKYKGVNLFGALEFEYTKEMQIHVIEQLKRCAPEAYPQFNVNRSRRFQKLTLHKRSK